MKEYTDNWVEVKPWMGDKSDKMLSKLAEMLVCKLSII
jgi:hypothetical protein